MWGGEGGGRGGGDRALGVYESHNSLLGDSCRMHKKRGYSQNVLGHQPTSLKDNRVSNGKKLLQFFLEWSFLALTALGQVPQKWLS